MQAISVIVTHRTDDMSKLPPRVPVNAPKPKARAPQAPRPKLRLNQPAHATGAAPHSLAPILSSPDQDAVMAEVDDMSDRLCEGGCGHNPVAAATAAAAGQEAAGAGAQLLRFEWSISPTQKLEYCTNNKPRLFWRFNKENADCTCLVSL